MGWQINHSNHAGESGPLGNSPPVFLLQEQSLYPKSTFMWKINRKRLKWQSFWEQSQLQTIYSLVRALYHSSHTKNWVLWYFNGLILNKGMEKWAKFLQELNRCISGRIPITIQKISWTEFSTATPSDCCPHTDRLPLLVLYYLLSSTWSEDSWVLHFK